MAAPSPAVAHHRSRKARLAQSYPPDHPKRVAADRDFAAAKITDYIERVIVTAPPLTPAQRDRIAAILQGSAV